VPVADKVCIVMGMMIATDRSMTFTSFLALCSLASRKGCDDLHVTPLIFISSSVYRLNNSSILIEPETGMGFHGESSLFFG
jgi:hypothetical protein